MSYRGEEQNTMLRKWHLWHFYVDHHAAWKQVVPICTRQSTFFMLQKYVSAACCTNNNYQIARHVVS